MMDRYDRGARSLADLDYAPFLIYPRPYPSLLETLRKSHDYEQS